jgi:hypothetical protein
VQHIHRIWKSIYYLFSGSKKNTHTKVSTFGSPKQQFAESLPIINIHGWIQDRSQVGSISLAVGKHFVFGSVSSTSADIPVEDPQGVPDAASFPFLEFFFY